MAHVSWPHEGQFVEPRFVPMVWHQGIGFEAHSFPPRFCILRRDAVGDVVASFGLGHPSL
jgi:hypothetical protein